MRIALVGACVAALSLAACSSSAPSSPPAATAPAASPVPTGTIRAASGSFWIATEGESADLSQGGAPPGGPAGELEVAAVVQDTMVSVTRLPAGSRLESARATATKQCRDSATPLKGTVTDGEQVRLDGERADGCSVSASAAGSRQRIWYLVTEHDGRVFSLTIQTNGTPAQALPRIANNWHWVR